MNLISKILAGVYYEYSKGDMETLSGLNLFTAKLALTVPLGLIGIFAIDKVVSSMNIESYQFLPEGNLWSLLYAMLFFPVIHFLSASKEELLQFIEQTEEQELKKYYRYFVYTLVISGVLFVAAVLMTK